MKKYSVLFFSLISLTVFGQNVKSVSVENSILLYICVCVLLVCAVFIVIGISNLFSNSKDYKKNMQKNRDEISKLVNSLK